MQHQLSSSSAGSGAARWRRRGRGFRRAGRSTVAAASMHQGIDHRMESPVTGFGTASVRRSAHRASPAAGSRTHAGRQSAPPHRNRQLAVAVESPARPRRLARRHSCKRHARPAADRPAGPACRKSMRIVRTANTRSSLLAQRLLLDARARAPIRCARARGNAGIARGRPRHRRRYLPSRPVSATERRGQMPLRIVSRTGPVADGGRLQAQVAVGLGGGHAAARGAHDVALLDQVGLDHVLERAALLAERRGQRFHADRAAVEDSR